MNVFVHKYAVVKKREKEDHPIWNKSVDLATYTWNFSEISQK